MTTMQPATTTPIAISGADLDAILSGQAEKRDVRDFHRLLISFRRVTRPRADGTNPDGTRPLEDRECSVAEFYNFVHPNDEPVDDNPQHQRRASKYNIWREMGELFRGNPKFFAVQYTTYSSVLPA